MNRRLIVMRGSSRLLSFFLLICLCAFVAGISLGNIFVNNEQNKRIEILEEIAKEQGLLYDIPHDTSFEHHRISDTDN